jgi:hypothetical protein
MKRKRVKILAQNCQYREQAVQALACLGHKVQVKEHKKRGSLYENKFFIELEVHNDTEKE